MLDKNSRLGTMSIIMTVKLFFITDCLVGSVVSVCQIMCNWYIYKSIGPQMILNLVLTFLIYSL